jgi:H/ACA ribonucleoprotein complex subunit 3
MARKILQCCVCKIYTLKETCCEQKTHEIKPPKYSPDDKYGKYRREVKKEELEAKGLV